MGEEVSIQERGLAIGTLGALRLGAVATAQQNEWLEEIPKPRTERQQRAETGGVRGVGGLRKQPVSGQEGYSVEDLCLRQSRKQLI